MDESQLKDVWRFPGRSTRAIVDLDAIAGNVRAVRGEIGSAVRLMAVVKANAYGHGAIAVSLTALDAGADELAVATVDEGVQLRSAGIKVPILVLGPVDESEIDLAIGRALELPVGDLEFAHAVVAAVEQISVVAPVPVHLKIDTGMRRFGTEPGQSLSLARFVHNSPALKLRGAFSHFAHADAENEDPTRDQLAVLEYVLAELEEAGIQPEITHAANTAATLRSRAFDRDLVRLGIGLYGLAPSSDVSLASGMRSAMTLVSRVRRLISLSPGDTVSYGGTYRADTSEIAALVPVGYADGYRRSFSSHAWMDIQGLICPVRGRVCMDQTIVGVPDGGIVRVGDPVIIASGGIVNRGPTLDTLASLAGTINYEIATGISRRVPRYFVKDGHVAAIEDLHGHRLARTTQRVDT